MIAIVESRADRASRHICEQLRDRRDWEGRQDESRPDADGGGTYYRFEEFELRSFDALHLELERPAEAFTEIPDLLVFASRHSGGTGPLLTAHCTGNFGPGEFGGSDHAVADACPNALAQVLEAFDRHAPDGYDTGLECTHHGPTDVGCPSLFAELGSEEAQWADPDGACAVATSILELAGVDPHGPRQLVGFGGNHYVPRFERIVRDTPWTVGHVAADWALESLGDPAAHRDLIDTAFTASGATHAVIDGEWPGRDDLEAVIADLGYRVVSETWVREVGDRSLDLVEAVETRLGDVDTGVRFGDVRGENFDVVDLPGDLVAAAEGVDPDGVWATLEGEAVAFETRNGGSRVGGRAALPMKDGDAGGTSPEMDDATANEAARTILEAVCTILTNRYDEVAVDEDVVVAREVAFDPALARAAGVPEGPAFGTLADGDAVTVDGEVIEPEEVCRERTRSFALDVPFTRE